MGEEHTGGQEDEDNQARGYRDDLRWTGRLVVVSGTTVGWPVQQVHGLVSGDAVGSEVNEKWQEKLGNQK